MAENKSLKENCDKIQKEYNCLEKSCDGWEDQIKRIESQRDPALLGLSLPQTRMDTDTTKIEKGVTDAEGKYNKLKQQYRALELSCDKDLKNFQIELKTHSLESVREVALEQQQEQLNQIADLEKRLLDTNNRLLQHQPPSPA